jgi:hypothetical protein
VQDSNLRHPLYGGLSAVDYRRSPLRPMACIVSESKWVSSMLVRGHLPSIGEGKVWERRRLSAPATWVAFPHPRTGSDLLLTGRVGVDHRYLPAVAGC